MRARAASAGLAIAALLAPAPAVPGEETHLYRVEFLQAAPGRLLELVELVKARKADPPLSMRHSQGDRWDLMLLTPMGGYGEYFSPEREKRRREERSPRWDELVAFQEDLYALGPPPEEVRAAFAKAAFFHIEIFQALPGRRGDLLRERRMENAYQRALKRPENLVFLRDSGAAWDLFTIGCYRDLKHYAESADIPEKDQEAAAKAAGFEAASRIGPYLRQFIALHHHTLAVALK